MRAYSILPWVQYPCDNFNIHIITRYSGRTACNLLTLIKASSSAGDTHGFPWRKSAFSCVMVFFCSLSKGSSSAWNTKPPTTMYSTTTTNTANTVFHFITEWRAEPSATASMLATMLAEREEMERRGRGQCSFVFASQPMGFCMAATLAWTREDCTTPSCGFFGGAMFVWTTTWKRKKTKTKRRIC